MNLNLLSYALFFPAMLYTAVRVATLCHRYGAVWLMRLFGDRRFVDAVGRVLVAGCYMVDLGYVALVVSHWEPVLTMPHLLATLSRRIALILFTLAGLHYGNMAVLFTWSLLQHRSSASSTTDLQHP